MRYSTRWLAELAATAEPSTVGTRLRAMRRFCRWQLARLCQHWLDRARERLSAAAPARSSDES